MFSRLRLRVDVTQAHRLHPPLHHRIHPHYLRRLLKFSTGERSTCFREQFGKSIFLRDEKGTSLSCSRTMSWFNLRDGVVGEGEDRCRGKDVGY